jgi:hypothetical protein
MVNRFDGSLVVIHRGVELFRSEDFGWRNFRRDVPLLRTALEAAGLVWPEKYDKPDAWPDVQWPPLRKRRTRKKAKPPATGRLPHGTPHDGCRPTHPSGCPRCGQTPAGIIRDRIYWTLRGFVMNRDWDDHETERPAAVAYHRRAGDPKTVSVTVTATAIRVGERTHDAEASWDYDLRTVGVVEAIAKVRELTGVKPFCSFKPGVNPAYAWEPVIFSGGRKRGRELPTLRDWVSANITLRKGLSGSKPEAFSAWLFELLGLRPGDTFHDLFPGSGAVTAAWNKYAGLPEGTPAAFPTILPPPAKLKTGS